MKQTSFAQAEFAAKKKITRRERFLVEMEQAAPWSRLLKALSPYYYPDSRGMLMREGTIVDATIYCRAAIHEEPGQGTGSNRRTARNAPGQKRQ